MKPCFNGMNSKSYYKRKNHNNEKNIYPWIFIDHFNLYVFTRKENT